MNQSLFSRSSVFQCVRKLAASPWHIKSIYQTIQHYQWVSVCASETETAILTQILFPYISATFNSGFQVYDEHYVHREETQPQKKKTLRLFFIVQKCNVTHYIKDSTIRHHTIICSVFSLKWTIKYFAIFDQHLGKYLQLKIIADAAPMTPKNGPQIGDSGLSATEDIFAVFYQFRLVQKNINFVQNALSSAF